MTTWELWDIETRNLIDSHDDEDELRAALRSMASVHGVALARRDVRGRTAWLFRNDELLAVANSTERINLLFARKIVAEHKPLLDRLAELGDGPVELPHYVRLSDSAVVGTLEADSQTAVDYDADGRVVGIELL